MRNVAVILAGGVGTRMGGTMPKQFFKVSGKTVLEHTILYLITIRLLMKLQLWYTLIILKKWRNCVALIILRK